MFNSWYKYSCEYTTLNRDIKKIIYALTTPAAAGVSNNKKHVTVSPYRFYKTFRNTKGNGDI